MTIDPKKAIALRYDGKSAPKVTAKGKGMLAKEIIEVAKRHGIPIEQNEELTELLSQVRINHEIPEELYIAVAQVLAFLYHLNGMESDKTVLKPTEKDTQNWQKKKQ